MREIKNPELCKTKRLTLAEVHAQRNEPLSPRVLQDLAFVAALLPECTDWLVVKKRILLELPIDQRQLFSTRHPTKKHFPFNAFERRIREEWKKLTGNVLLMPDHRKLAEVDPELYL